MPQEWILKMNYLAENGIPFLFVLDFDLQRPVIEELEKINPKNILYYLNGRSNVNQKKPGTGSDAPELEAIPPTFAVYLEKFNKVKAEIQAGNTYLLNLSFSHLLKSGPSLNELFRISNAKYKLWLRDNFVLFSPETFVQVKDGIISTYPMKGTAEKTSEASANELLQDEKEAAEHATITDLLRNDLGKVADLVRVKSYRYIDEIHTRDKTILQVSSKISGRLRKKFTERPGDLFRELLPAGSVTGAPKKKTLEIIKNVENYQRGFYTGVFGIFDGKNIDSAVMIRFIEKNKKGLFYKSGGGITFMSDPEKEYREIIQKIYVPVY